MSHPVRVKILHYEFYVVSGAENIKALFKNSGCCTSTVFSRFALGYAFGLPAKALSLYDKDDSGDGNIPYPESTVEPRNRLDYLEHQSIVKFLEGKALQPFWQRYADDIADRFHALHERLASGPESHDDLMRYLQDEIATSTINAKCGPHLLRLNPNFLQDFFDFDRNLQKYLQGINSPQLTAPYIYPR
jgi:hypothetical protein